MQHRRLTTGHVEPQLWAGWRNTFLAGSTASTWHMVVADDYALLVLLCSARRPACRCRGVQRLLGMLSSLSGSSFCIGPDSWASRSSELTGSRGGHWRSRTQRRYKTTTANNNQAPHHAPNHTTYHIPHTTYHTPQHSKQCSSDTFLRR